MSLSSCRHVCAFALPLMEFMQRQDFFPYFLLDNSDLTYFVDCGIDTGYDAYKAMALGANAVAVGRGILAPLLKEGKDGVVKKVRKMNEQLSEMMMYTGIADTLSFDASVIHFL